MKTKEELRSEVEFLDAHLVAIDKSNEGRSLDPDEQIRFDEGLTARAAAKAELDAIEAREAELAAIIRERPTAVVSGDGAFNAPGLIVRNDPFDLSDLRLDSTTSEIRSKAFGAIEKIEGMADDQRARAEHIVRTIGGGGSREIATRVVLASSPAYRNGWMKVYGGSPELVTHEEQQALAAYRAASLSGSAGGYAVPTPLDPTMIDTGSHSTNPFRQISRVIPWSTNVWKGVSSAGVTASWDNEATEVSDDAPTLAQPTITCKKAQVFVPFSIEVEGDWANLQADLFAMISRAKDDLEGAAFATGSAPIGITTALDGTSSEIAPTTAETFALADIYKVESSLQARYRSNASWIANKTVYSKVRQFDTTGGNGLWERIGAAQPAQLLGYNAYECSDMDGVLPDAAATADNFLMVLGDFSNYVIVDRVGLNVELVPHMLATANNLPNGQRGFYAWFRTGADSVNDAGFAMLSIPTAA